MASVNVEGSELKPGVIVEELASKSEAARADLREGDILLRWSQDGISRDIESPFDLDRVQLERQPRGFVTVDGFRGEEEHRWILGPSAWMLVSEARPRFTDGLLQVYRQGKELAKTGKFNEFVALWQGVTQEHRIREYSWIGLWFLVDAGSILDDQQQWRAANRLYKTAIYEAERIKVPMVVEAAIFALWGRVSYQQSDWGEAEKHYTQALVEYQKADADVSAADILVMLSIIAINQGHLTAAEGYLEQSRVIMEGLAPHSLNAAEIFLEMGEIARARGELDHAEECYRQAMQIQEEISPVSFDVALSLHHLALVARDRGELTKADEYSQQALTIAAKYLADSSTGRSTRDILGLMATILNNLGVVADERGDLIKAEEHLGRCLDIRNKLLHDEFLAASTLHDLGILAAERGDLVKSGRYSRKALSSQLRISPVSFDVGLSLNSLGELALRLGHLHTAEAYFRRALVVYNELAPSSLLVADTLNDLGTVANDLGNLSKAEQYFRQAFAIQQQVIPNSLETAQSLSNLGKIAFRQHRFEIAKEYYRQALAITETLATGSNRDAETLAALGRALLGEGRVAAAGELFERALDALQNQVTRLGGTYEARSSYRSEHAQYYSDQINVLMQENKPESAFAVSERYRAQTLLEMLSEAHIDIHQGMDPAVLEREKSLAAMARAKVNRRIQLLEGNHTDQQIQAITQEIENLYREYEDVQGQIRSNSPAYAALTRPHVPAIQEIQEQLLDSQTLLLEYALGEKHSYLFAVSYSSLTSYELPPASNIETLARRVYRLMTARKQILQAETAMQTQSHIRKADRELLMLTRRLSSLILAPAASQMAGKRLLVVADGALQFIPFGMLPAPHSGSPLIEEHEIVSLPSASVLALLRKEGMSRKLPPKMVAVIADPVFDAKDSRVTAGFPSRDPEASMGVPDWASFNSPSAELLTRSAGDLGLRSGTGIFLPRLLFSRQEADAIMELAPLNEGMAALDFNASLATATSSALAQYQIIHFATHGLLDNKHPELSGLVFSLVDKRGRTQEGFLSLQDIYNLDLPVDLVVLSACETALGKDLKGEGLAGLTRAFMYAGATRVVASLWSVDDQATAELMKRFYRGMLQDHLPAAVALRKAQVQMLKETQWKEPYYWAGFVIQGDWR